MEKKVKAVKTEAKTEVRHYREFTGTVVAARMQKTITVKVNTFKLHPKYQKRYRVSATYHVHDETGSAKVGDMVTFRECRPLSKTKRWYLVNVKKSK